MRPPGFRGAAFGSSGDGDGGSDPKSRRRISDELGVPAAWAVIRQVHGADVIEADGPGRVGAADGVFTRVPDLPLAVTTADCVPVVLEGPSGVGVAHAGWQGAAAGVVAAAREAMEVAGATPVRAAIGPGIGPCCFEVGPEVSNVFPANRTRTRWGTASVDLWGSVASELDGLEVWRADTCTHCGKGYFSYRRDRTGHRQVAVGWLPRG
ncbi:MAG: polyphenol oxidase family protein [Acidimicrobiia bacterium]